MPEDRPRPQYGEYATPEQQAKAMGREYAAPASPSAPHVPPPGQPPATPPAGAMPPQSLGVVLNRIVTILFLAYGAIMFINDIPIYTDFAASFNKVLSAAGNPLRVTSAFDAVGTWGLIVNVVLYLATVAVSFWQLRRGKLSFYIPIVGFAAFLIVMVILAVTVGHFSPF